MIKKALQIGLFTALAWSMSMAPIASAAYYNFGTLDVRPVHQNENPTNEDWFVEYLKPGEKKQQFIQVSNFSPETKQLDIYAADTSVNEGKNFYTKELHEDSDDVSDWIHLPTNKILLQSGESKILSVNFTLPQNAGIGLHTGAVIIRENGKEFAMEKGVRVYLNVVGTAIENGNIQSINSYETASNYTLQVKTANTGTTDFNADYELQLRDIFGTTHNRTAVTSRTEPRTVSTSEISVEKPYFGLYHLYLLNEKEENFIGTVLFIPFWIPLGALLFLLFALRPEFNIQTVRRLIQLPEFRRSFAYFGLFSIVATTSVSVATVESNVAKAQLARGQTVRELTDGEQAAESYELTVKWGTFRNALFPRDMKKEWHGRLYFPNAHIKTTELLHFERNDQAELTDSRQALRFDALTGPDNDGLILFVEPIGNEIPRVQMENYDTGEEFEFLITDYLDSPGIYPDRFWGTSFKTDYSEQEKLRRQSDRFSILSELDSTAELEATPSPVAQIPELENLFIEELPATREALADVILRSDYVEEVVEENSTRKIKTDNILIEALEATPDVLEDIAATPDLNFIFVPSETINFPAQEFSFNQDKSSEQNLGTLIFVQNKGTPWNTFVGTTDFQLLSGDAVIPASSLTISPGEATLIAEGDVATDESEEGNNGRGALQRNINATARTQIAPGQQKKMSGDFDRTTLVDVDAAPGKKAVFVLTPTLKIDIPKGTPAGTYRGALTITSL